MWEPQRLTPLTVSTACTGLTSTFTDWDGWKMQRVINGSWKWRNKWGQMTDNKRRLGTGPQRRVLPESKSSWISLSVTSTLYQTWWEPYPVQMDQMSQFIYNSNVQEWSGVNFQLTSGEGTRHLLLRKLPGRRVLIPILGRDMKSTNIDTNRRGVNRSALAYIIISSLSIISAFVRNDLTTYGPPYLIITNQSVQ
jgi:hypothetical protein